MRNLTIESKAIKLGLKREDLEGHSWDSTNENDYIGGRTITYLQDQISKGKDVSEAFKEIKGLDNGYQIRAIEKGLKREDLKGHDWVSNNENNYSGRRSIVYLESCPAEIPLKRAMANIRGCKMIDIENNKNAGISAGLSLIQVYAAPLTSIQVIQIQNGELYNDVAPEGAKFILELEQRKEQRKQYTIGAASEAISKIMEIKEIEAPEKVGFGARIASHLTTKQGEMLAKVTTKTLEGAKTFEQIEINRQTKEREKGGQNR